MRFSTILTRVAPLAAIVALPLGAQNTASSAVVGNGVNIAGESATERAPLFTSSAFVAPKSHYGFAVQAHGRSSSIEEGGVEVSASVSQTVVSGYYGVTDKITLGAFLPYDRANLKIEGAGALDMDEDASGMGEAGVFGRFGAYKSTSGNTRLAVLAGVQLPTAGGDFENDEAKASYGFGAALSHRLGRWSLHAAPEVSFIDQLDPTFNMNFAGVFAASPKMNVSVEALTVTGGAVSDVDGAEGQRDIDLGAGLRYRFGSRLALDGGFRYNVATNLEEGEEKPTTVGVLLGLNWQF